MAWHLLPREWFGLILPRLSLDDMVHLRTLDRTARAAVDGTVPLYVLRAHRQQVLQLQQQLAAEWAKERQWLDSNLNMSVADIPLYEAAGACFAPRAPLLTRQPCTVAENQCGLGAGDSDPRTPSEIVELLTKWDGRACTLEHMAILLCRLLQGLVGSAVGSSVFEHCARSVTSFLEAIQSSQSAVMGPLLEHPRTFLGSARDMLNTQHHDDDDNNCWDDLYYSLKGSIRAHFQ